MRRCMIGNRPAHRDRADHLRLASPAWGVGHRIGRRASANRRRPGVSMSCVSFRPAALRSSASSAGGSLPAAGDGQHDDIDRQAARVEVLGQNPLDDEKRRVVGRGSPDRGQDGDGFGIGPVVKHLHDQVGVADRERVDEEAARLAHEPGMRGSSCLDDARQVEQDASCLGCRLENRVQQVAVAAADVDDPGERTRSRTPPELPPSPLPPSRSWLG